MFGITTLQSMSQKKASLIELSVNNRQSRALLAGGFNFDSKNNEWSAKVTQTAVEVARKVGTTEMCGTFDAEYLN